MTKKSINVACNTMEQHKANITMLKAMTLMTT